MGVGDKEKGNTLFQRRPVLFVRPSGPTGHASVRAGVENVLPIDHALAQSSPAFGVVIVRVFGIHGDLGDHVLELGKVAHKLGDSHRAVFVDYEYGNG